MKNVKIISMFIAIVMILQIVIPAISFAENEELVEIKFEDINLYSKISLELSDIIDSKDDDSLTIKMNQADIDSVKKIDSISNAEIVKLNGIEYFKNLEELKLYSTQISDITPLSSLTNLKELTLSSNKINNFGAISNLVNLVSLDIYKCDLSDITFLSDLKKLEFISLEDNNLSDISVFSNLTNLREVNISNNKIKKICDISNLKNLYFLDLSKNEINNIDDLANLPKQNNFLHVDLSYNNIIDLKALSNINIIYYLNLSNNKISNVYDLSKLKINFLILENNNIDDLSIVDNNDLITLFDEYSHSQTITLSNKDKKKEIDLPKIFIQAQSGSSKLYTDKELILTNCKLSDDKSKVVIDNLEENSTIQISGGLVDSSILTIGSTDVTAPVLEVEYSKLDKTDKDVVVTITANEEIKEIEGWELSENKKVLTKTYSENASEEIMVYDLNNNGSKVNIVINNIDKDKFYANVSYSTIEKTNQDVIVTISSNKELKEVAGWLLSENKNTLTKIYTKNLNEDIDIFDIQGNSIKVNVNVSNIDKIAPECNVEYSQTEATKNDVEVKIISNEEVQAIDGWNLSEDKKILSKKYTSNVNEEVIVTDLAGNIAQVKVEINNIERIIPNFLPFTGLQENKNIVFVYALVAIAFIGIVAFIIIKIRNK